MPHIVRRVGALQASSFAQAFELAAQIVDVASLGVGCEHVTCIRGLRLFQGTQSLQHDFGQGLIPLPSFGVGQMNDPTLLTDVFPPQRYDLTVPHPSSESNQQKKVQHRVLAGLLCSVNQGFLF